MNDATRFNSTPQVPALLTVEEFQRFVDLDVLRGADKLELDKGVIVRMSPARGKHMRLQHEIFEQLYDLLRDDPLGRLAHFEFSVLLGDATLRDVDVAIVTQRPADDAYGEPEMIVLAIEVSNSTLEYDLTDKARDYALSCIPHYWVVDAEHGLVHAMSKPLDSVYTERHPVPFGEPLTVPGTDRTIVIS